MQLADVSSLQKARAQYQPKLPAVLKTNGPFVVATGKQPTRSVADSEQISRRFPRTYGAPVITFAQGETKPRETFNLAMIFSGGQAPGGHNVAAGLCDALHKLNPDNKLYGFLGGPGGLVDNQYKIIDPATIDAYRNTGGFDLIGSGRTKLETPEQFAQVAKTCRENRIKAIVVVGGDDSNTNACMLAEYFMENQIGVQVIGCPKTIDGDLKNPQIQASFGFDTATKVYSELIGNIQRDASSARKYWHFIKLMGRSASHIALECALQTHPTVTLISEEVAARQLTLDTIVEELAATVRERARRGAHFGVVLIPEGLIEFIPEMKSLIAELNDLLARHERQFAAITEGMERIAFIADRLDAEPASLFRSLPDDIKLQLVMDRDPHGNVQVSRIETEKLLVTMVEQRLRQWSEQDNAKIPFSAQHHFFGYEGRCAAPSNFDADYCYSLGYTAACLVATGKTGYLASVRGLEHEADKWQAGGIPLTMMMNMERRKGREVPVIRKALVDLKGTPFQTFAAHRELWRRQDCFVYPGPIQYFGPPEVVDQSTLTLQLESS